MKFLGDSLPSHPSGESSLSGLQDTAVVSYVDEFSRQFDAYRLNVRAEVLREAESKSIPTILVGRQANVVNYLEERVLSIPQPPGKLLERVRGEVAFFRDYKRRDPRYVAARGITVCGDRTFMFDADQTNIVGRRLGRWSRKEVNLLNAVVELTWERVIQRVRYNERIRTWVDVVQEVRPEGSEENDKGVEEALLLEEQARRDAKKLSARVFKCEIALVKALIKCGSRNPWSSSGRQEAVENVERLVREFVVEKERDSRIGGGEAEVVQAPLKRDSVENVPEVSSL